MLDNQTEKQNFSTFLVGVAAAYQKSVSPQAMKIWFMTLRNYDLEAIQAAFESHLKDTDTGRYFPTIADIVKHIEGGTEDRALAAWALVDRTVRAIGPYTSVAFPDPIIHCCVRDMGGWQLLGNSTSEEWPYLKNEFIKRYRVMASSRRLPPAVPQYLMGIIETNNYQLGAPIAQPKLIGEGADQLRLAQEIVDGKYSRADDQKRLSEYLPANVSGLITEQ